MERRTNFTKLFATVGTEEGKFRPHRRVSGGRGIKHGCPVGEGNSCQIEIPTGAGQTTS